VNKIGKILLYVGVVCMLVILAENEGFAQQKKRVIQLSGIVLGDSVSGGLPGVHIYVPKAGRGTTSNNVGFFSLPVLVGDSIVISSVGFVRQHFIVPDNSPEYQTIIISMITDVTMLQDVVIMDFPTEEVFKQAILALNIPTDQSGVSRDNMNQELLALMMKTTPMDGYQNQRYYLNQWANSATDKFQPVSNPLLNPFNWAKFFQSLKKKK
jgi:hypothetical protein